MSAMLAGKVALVAAGAAGIGRGSALALAREGARVLVGDIDVAQGEQTVADILAAGGDAVFRRIDVTVPEQVADMIAYCVSHFGRLDVAHNNAGAMRGAPGLVTFDEADWDWTVDLCMKASWSCMKQEILHMRAHGGGAIVNTASMSGKKADRSSNAAYTAAKAGVCMMTAEAALLHAVDNIRVNCIAPGLVRTPLIERIYTAEMQAQMAGIQPINRLIEPGEIGDAVVFLASDRAAMITGITLPVDGGYHL